jgi:hypothetical protein
MNRAKVVAVIFMVVAGLSLSGCAAETDMAPTPSPTQTVSQNLPADLQYLIEEEKLAHDVYTAMYELWGARVFGNILKSESSHQGQVLAIMNAYNVADPRLAEPGEFVNQELQDLYDQLIEQGTKSEQAAFEVGVAIEELDIKDLNKMLETVTQDDVAVMMQNLIAGSENHLAAFQRQL